ncbi:MAG: hypothetical protein A2498_15860 [Lentisphaerae bacterium RIFOXYC12_FULL_60_16]|nr:MAG: hypothetical protein A2498_15860 [Lentisphaerae bacterium RIFOXYC12_FULL_60_16]OGV73914.1 MAG: hypothetical protein A2269_04155 [Lentisphaerae bacterium RIFOXYA12_FULL_60_10]OGV79149.1 MAG: hypothetical protein A2340_03430 [Lentisphaerae bacterium RIFOXYB12_FULL_60_10]
MDCRLVLTSESGNEPFVLAEGITTLGRATDNHIQLTQHAVSRHHARIHNLSSVVEIEDLGSANGTKVNGTRITRVRLAHGAQIAVGDANFLFEETDAIGLEDAAQHRDYSTRARATTVRIKPVQPVSASPGAGSGARPLRPVRPFVPNRPKDA